MEKDGGATTAKADNSPQELQRWVVESCERAGGIDSPGRAFSTTVNVGATVELLLGTDVLLSLGFSLQAKEAGGSTHDLLTSKSCPTAKEENKPTVRLIQTVRLPPQHKRVVRAQLDKVVTPSTLLLFEPGDHLLERDGLRAAEAAVMVEDTGQVTLILENHSCEPTSLEERLVLGNVIE